VYYEEDLFLSRELAADFDLVLCPPKAAAAFLLDVDGVLFRNAGPVAGFAAEYVAFQEVARAHGVKVFNQLTGKADMCGKQYLVDLYGAGFPVIPTVDRRADLDRLPASSSYVVKPKDGADSSGLRRLDGAALRALSAAELDGQVVQPAIDFVYEVSFYFLNDRFHYALHAPRPEERWRLETYEPSADDLRFARRFIAWNDIDQGIQRVDAVRTRGGDLLLMELEDINPFLSLDRLPEAVRDAFVGELRRVLGRWIRPFETGSETGSETP
jgi:hypothetical protein